MTYSLRNMIIETPIRNLFKDTDTAISRVAFGELYYKLCHMTNQELAAWIIQETDKDTAKDILIRIMNVVNNISK